MTRLAVVAGGTAGVGLANARALADRGWDVAVLARDEARLRATMADLEGRGRRALGITTDMSDAGAVEHAAERVEAELGTIDLWVNGPMAGAVGPFLDLDVAEFDRVTAVTYLGFVNGTRAALRRMVPRDTGHVIQTGSALAHRGMPLLSAYSGAKFATRGFTEAVVAELRHARSRVRISMLELPALNTPQYDWMSSHLPHHPRPIPLVFDPEAVARVVAYVAEHPRTRTWVAEPSVLAIVGNRISGGLFDRVIARFGIALQQAPDQREPMLPSNLVTPTPGDVGVHGSFHGRVFTASPQLWAVTHRRAAAVIGAAAAAAGAAALVTGIGRRA
ncbi:MAG TPA: SDR family oxidoreductase [Agromyces sp.]|nr:SDR family oxidoreductase [Agromyces sp.]